MRDLPFYKRNCQQAKMSLIVIFLDINVVVFISFNLGTSADIETSRAIDIVPNKLRLVVLLCFDTVLREYVP